MAGYVCKIIIEGTHPPVWRRVVIPDKITFLELHQIIQVLFGWDDDHLHEFTIPSDYICIDGEDETWGYHYSESQTLIDSFFRNYKWVRYTYDFGDDWRHRINIEKLDSGYNERFAVLMKNKGDNFLEDSGGIWGDDLKNRSVFDKEYVAGCLMKMIFPPHNELQEVKLLKESMDELRKVMLRMREMNVDTLNGILSETFQDEGKKISPMTRKINEWRAFDENGSEKVLELIPPSKSQEELLMDLGKKEATDYYKYLRLPQDKLLSREAKISAVSAVLREHPEYLLYIFDENEYSDLLELTRMTPGKMTKQPKSKNMLIKMFGLGLGDFTGTKNSGKISLAADIEKYAGVVDTKTKKKTYRELRQFDERFGKLIQFYGVIELESLYDIYKRMYQKDIEKESLFRYIYWHARFNDFVNTVYTMDGTCYVSFKDLDVRTILEKTEDYGKNLSYKEYTAEDMNYYLQDLANRSEWLDVLFTILHFDIGLDLEDAQYLIFEATFMIMNGDSLDQVIEELKNLSQQTWNFNISSDIWLTISGIMLDLPLPMLKGRSRMMYAEEEKCSPWSVGMLTEFDDIKNTKTRKMYHFPQEIQQMMYELNVERGGNFKKLFDYKEQNHICSEEFLYLLIDGCIISGIYINKAKKLMRELRNSSPEGKKAANHLNTLLKEREDVLADDFYPFNDFGGVWFPDSEKVIDTFPDFEVQMPYVRENKKIGRNDPCPCGSGKKYKKCCGRNS